MSRLLTEKKLLDYHKRKFPHMYQGNDRHWCKDQQDKMRTALNDYYTKLAIEAQRDLSDRECQDKGVRDE